MGDSSATSQVFWKHSFRSKTRNAEASDRILDQIVDIWKARGMDLLNSTTWNNSRPVSNDRYAFQTFDHKLSEADLQAGRAFLASAFPKKCRVVANQSIERIMLAMAKLALIKHQEENGITAAYWQSFFRDQFHLELCVRNVWDVLKAALELEIIAKHCGWHRGRATMYTVGQRMAKYLDVPSTKEGSITLVCKKERPLPQDAEFRLTLVVTTFEEQLELCV